jgi:hypothetical protein
MCETSFDADLPEEIDLDEEPGRLQEMLSGAFFEVTCPSCGTVLKPELTVRVRSRQHGLDLQVVPELERLSFHLNEVETPKGAELLIGYGELFERARMVKDGLDPEAVEIIKYYLRIKAEESANEAAEISVSYAGLQGEEELAGPRKLLFHISGIKEGELAVLPIGRDYYGRILADKAKTKKSEPFDRVFKGPYRSIRVLEAAGE